MADKGSARVGAGQPQTGRPEGSTASGIWAVRALLQNVPDFMPWPEVKVENDGAIGFDWDGGRHCVLSMHVDDMGRAGWAALIGEHKSHGSFTVDFMWPEELFHAFRLFDTQANQR